MAGSQKQVSAPPVGHEEPAVFGRYLGLVDRLYAFVVVRAFVSLAIVAAAVFAQRVVGIERLDVASLTLLAVVLWVCNTVTFILISPYRRNPERAFTARRFLVTVMNFSIIVDFMCLTVTLWLVGGPKSPFQAFFIFHVIIASVLLAPKHVAANVLFGYFLFAGLVVGTWREWIPARYPTGAVPCSGPINGRFALTVLTVQAMLFTLTAVLVVYLTKMLRDREQQLLETNAALDRLSAQRRDFLQIALHNLRSPVSAVSMLMGNLREGYGGPLTEKQETWVTRAETRLTELAGFLYDLESLAILESGDLGKYSRAVDLRPMLEELVNQNQDLARARGHSLTLEMEKEPAFVNGVARLIREAAVNYVTNAIKYTPANGRIVVRVVNRPDVVRIEVQDNGVGISPGDQARLFQEFVRVNKHRPEVAQVPGSGLGLFIVRRIAEAHGGRVEVISREGEGSTFALELSRAVTP